MRICCEYAAHQQSGAFRHKLCKFLCQWEQAPAEHMPAPLHPRAAGLCLFGFLGAFLGGANVLRGGMRVVLGGWMALGVVYGIGRALNVDASG